ncbi:NHLP bacteriocin export ABC transporter permease/ATPase subunit [Congregibacter variabilis]|uniref:NHLP bacteriocin export ABC transporter permease/ATPase subunit n=1 Tax=Congregibacter variabilis TaxID=3081200 RepID=A0ABZ0I3K9_9GAMM|nr:NHLP bacteriocin export ABC transporter permease/ATPase subunit [Congregibacter sp. IMCC43200]
MRDSEPILFESTEPWLLNGSSSLWHVSSGAVDLFAVALEAGKPVGSRSHLYRIEANQCFAGLAATSCDIPVGVLAVAVPDTQYEEHRDAVQQVDGVRREHLLSCFQTWFLVLDRILPRSTLETVHVPRPPEFGQVDAMSMSAILDHYHALLLEYLPKRLKAKKLERAARLSRKQEREDQTFTSGLRDLASVLGSAQASYSVAGAEKEGVLLEVCQLVLDASGIKAHLSSGTETGADGGLVEQFARQAGATVRRVQLTQDTWWRTDTGPLLAFEGESGRPLAILPDNTGHGLWVVDIVIGSRRRLSSRLASTLGKDAFMFFRSFPERAIGLRDLVFFGMRGTGKDFERLLAVGAFGGLLGVFTPYATGRLVERIIPGALTGELVQMVVLLLVAAIGISAFEITKSIAFLRIDSRADLATQSAIIHRLLHLPAAFFRGYSAGDLAQRVFGISGILQTISNTFQTAFISWVFGLFSYAYLFYIDWRLALMATLLVVVSLLFTLAINLWRLSRERQLIELEGRLSSLVFQLLGGIAKLRAAGGEKSAFALWAKSFSEQSRLSFSIGWAQNLLTSFNAGYVVINSLVLFAAIAYLIPQMDAGSFVAFNTAFVQFFAATLAMIGAVTGSLNIIPMYERSLPVLTTAPETDIGKSPPGVLSGEIDISRISFSYDVEGPKTIDDVSIRIKAGEFVAFVGPSGSGKSTLFRLLLGFETPETGAIYYDGKDLADLDCRGVRRQLGVVLQNGQLMFGDIFTNIVGSSPLTVEDAWEAARMAGFDEDIRDMPMGMHTMISEGAGTISGGQKQRLMIARAVVKKPKILLFDEATSALDNHTQAIVSKSILELNATRVVVAHRLSTIVNADRIFVVKAGRIVEAGSYDELMQLRCHFYDLAERQLC